MRGEMTITSSSSSARNRSVRSLSGLRLASAARQAAAKVLDRPSYLSSGSGAAGGSRGGAALHGRPWERASTRRRTPSQRSTMDRGQRCTRVGPSHSQVGSMRSGLPAGTARTGRTLLAGRAATRAPCAATSCSRRGRARSPSSSSSTKIAGSTRTSKMWRDGWRLPISSHSRRTV